MFAQVVRRLRAGGHSWLGALGRISPATILIAGAALAFVYGFPGFMNYDSAEQLRQARANAYDDWHPPMMGWYWHYSEKLMAGPLPLLLLQLALFLWGLYGILNRRFQPRTAALMSVAILWFPAVLTPMAVVWKDAQMVGFLIAGIMLCLGESRRSRIAGVIVLCIASAVRDNACSALPPFLLVIAAAWGFRNRIVICAVGFALFVGIAVTAREANVKLTDGRADAWAKTNAIHDIAGMICFADPMSDDDVREALAGIPLRDNANLQQRFCEQYNPRWWFPLSFNERGLFQTQPTEADKAARKAAYFRLLRAHPKAFLIHRWHVSKELLGLGVGVPDEPVCGTFAGAPYQAFELRLPEQMSASQLKLQERFTRYSLTLMFRPWAYALVGLIVLLYGIYKRDGLVMALIGSGYLYELSFMLAAAGAPFRYSHWMILCTCIATMIVFGERLRAGLQARQGMKELGSAQAH